MWQGELFENLRDAAGATMNNVPYRRESFTLKEMVFPFDANFNRLDEQGMRNQYVGKNIAELNATIDSVTARIDSAGVVIARELRDGGAVFCHASGSAGRAFEKGRAPRCDHEPASRCRQRVQPGRLLSEGFDSAERPVEGQAKENRI